MLVNDEMIAAAAAVLRADIDPSAWMTNDEVCEALFAALAAAPIITPAITADKSPACPHIRSTGEGTHWCALAAAPQAEPVSRVVKTAPARIWLQVSDDLEHEDEPFPRGSLASEVTWSEVSVMDVEVQYVRADLVMPQPAPPQAAEPSEAEVSAVMEAMYGAPEEYVFRPDMREEARDRIRTPLRAAAKVRWQR